MKFLSPLENVRFLKRYKRFFADVELDSGEILTVHVPNTGSMKGLVELPCPARISRSDSPTRKLKGTLEMLQPGSSWVGVHTQRANALIAELLSRETWTEWQSWPAHQAEVHLNPKTRIDFVLSSESPTKRLCADDFRKPCTTPRHLIEVKSVTMAQGEAAMFPDAPSERALKHIHELMEQKALGHSVEIAFVIQREDCTIFKPAKEIDPKYAKALQGAQREGLKVTAFKCRLSDKEVHVVPEKIPVSFQ